MVVAEVVTSRKILATAGLSYKLTVTEVNEQPTLRRHFLIVLKMVKELTGYELRIV